VPRIKILVRGRLLVFQLVKHFSFATLFYPIYIHCFTALIPKDPLLYDLSSLSQLYLYYMLYLNNTTHSLHSSTLSIYTVSPRSHWRILCYTTSLLWVSYISTTCYILITLLICYTLLPYLRLIYTVSPRSYWRILCYTTSLLWVCCILHPILII